MILAELAAELPLTDQQSLKGAFCLAIPAVVLWIMFLMRGGKGS